MMLYNIFHNKLFDAMYAGCPEILNNVTFFGVNQKYPKLYSETKGYHIVWEWGIFPTIVPRCKLMDTVKLLHSIMSIKTNCIFLTITLGACSMI